MAEEVDIVEAAIARPKSVTVVGVGSNEQHSLPDVLLADRHITSSKVARDPAKAFARYKIRHGSPV